MLVIINVANGSFVNYYMYRGRDFRTEFANISEVRSLVPPQVPLMALTATASRATQQAIMKSLNMSTNTEVVSVLPNKVNVMYSVVRSDGDMDEAMSGLIESLVENGTKCDRAIVYCHTLMDCANVYRVFRIRLGSSLLHPPGAPNLAKYCLVDMYSSCTH